MEYKISSRARKVEDLKIRIKEEFDSLRSNKPLIKRVTASINNRISECIANNGNTIEIS